MEYDVPVCAAFWRAAAVFTGRLVDVKLLKNPPDKDRRYVNLQFRIEEPYRGVSGRYVYVVTTSGSICDLKFRKGERYLVYALQDGKRLVTGLCLRTKLLKYAKQDLAYIRTVTQDSAQESVSGKVIQSWQGRAGVKVTLEGDGKTLETTTDKYGDFFFPLPGPGTFKVRVFVGYEAGLLHFSDERAVTTTASTTLTTFEYDLTLEKNECHYQQLNVVRL
ncbi:MAG TPA: carboxypeptidase-like regulatory domain-containing protein [Pyrinomonadaceae bacterium]